MPGSGHKFFVAGKYSIRNNSDSTLKKVELKQIIIYQDKNLIYSFTPFVNDLTMSESTAFTPRQSRDFMFGTDPGLKLNNKLNSEKNVSAKFTFISGDKILELISDNIKIEKVY